MKKLVFSLALLSSVGSLAADMSGVPIRFGWCGTPNRSQTICTAHSRKGHFIVIHGTAPEQTTFLHAKAKRAPSRVNIDEVYTGWQIEGDWTKGFVEKEVKLSIKGNLAHRRSLRAQVTINGKSDVAGYSGFEVRHRR